MNYNSKNLKVISSSKSTSKSPSKSPYELPSNYINSTNISGIDTYGSKTDQSQVEKSYGHPTVSRYRC